MKKIARFFVVALALGLLVAYYMYNKPHRDIVKADVSEFITLDQMFSEFENEESQAFQQYHNKVVVISARLLSVQPVDGEVASAQLEGATGRANCQLHSSQSVSEWSDQVGDDVKVKGLFVGFDDLLGEIQLKEVTFYHD